MSFREWLKKDLSNAKLLKKAARFNRENLGKKEIVCAAAIYAALAAAVYVPEIIGSEGAANVIRESRSAIYVVKPESSEPEDEIIPKDESTLKVTKEPVVKTSKQTKKADVVQDEEPASTYVETTPVSYMVPDPVPSEEDTVEPATEAPNATPDVNTEEATPEVPDEQLENLTDDTDEEETPDAPVYPWSNMSDEEFEAYFQSVIETHDVTPYLNVTMTKEELLILLLGV